MLLAACKPSAPEVESGATVAVAAAADGVTLTAEQIRDLGITTSPARAATYRQAVAGYGSVIALDAVAQADADIETAAAAAQQSAAAAERAHSLATGEEAAVSREAVEAAQSKAASEAVALALAERRFQALFGLSPPWHTAAERRELVAQLARGEAVLARLTFPLGALGGEQVTQLNIARLGKATQSWPCRKVWEAPADPALPGTGFYCLLESANLAQNERLIGTMYIGAEARGVWVPQAALLVGENAMWVYVEPEPGHFVRVPVDANKLDGEGFFVDVSAGIAADENVVIGAAGLLLARELDPASEAED